MVSGLVCLAFACLTVDQIPAAYPAGSRGSGKDHPGLVSVAQPVFLSLGKGHVCIRRAVSTGLACDMYCRMTAPEVLRAALNPSALGQPGRRDIFWLLTNTSVFHSSQV